MSERRRESEKQREDVEDEGRERKDDGEVRRTDERTEQKSSLRLLMYSSIENFTYRI